MRAIPTEGQMCILNGIKCACGKLCRPHKDIVSFPVISRIRVRTSVVFKLGSGCKGGYLKKGAVDVFVAQKALNLQVVKVGLIIFLNNKL